LLLKKKLWQPFDPPAGIVATSFAKLVAAYSGSGRHYHNLHHLESVLAEIDRLKAIARDFQVIEFAAWFHDAVYVSGAGDNEGQSAAWAGKVLASGGVSDRAIAKCQQMILDTKTHLCLVGDIDTQILLDADMSILGAREKEYWQYCREIEQEYSYLSNADYCQGRLSFLQGLLQRESIYLTAAMRQRREKKYVLAHQYFIFS